MSLAIALTAALAGYAILLSSHRPAPATAAPVRLEALPELREPERLEPRRAVPAGFDAGGPATTALGTPLVLSIGGARDVGPTAGIAVFEAATDALVQWLPLADATAQGDRLELRTRVPADVRLRLHAAPSLRAARRGAWTAQPLGPGIPAEPVAIDLLLQDVRVRIAAVPPALGKALQLRRIGDPGWLPLDCGFDASPEGALDLRLAPGDYELRALAAPDRTGVVRVPGPREQTVAFTRPLVPGDRP